MIENSGSPPSALLRQTIEQTCDATIPLFQPYVVGDEIDLMSKVIWSGHLCGDGHFTEKCHDLLQHELHCQKVLLTTSCTHALEMAALLLEIQPGDEVILPSYTFVSTANAFVNRGAVPIFSDIRPDTLNLDERKLESLISSRTKAIAVVHYAGVACEMNTIMAIANRYGIPVVEDTAHALFGYYRSEALGTIGTFGTASFHQTKNFSCGEGGALLINDHDFDLRAEIVREKGTNRKQFLRGQVDRYSWCDHGSSYLPSEILAAHLYAQLREHAFIQRKRELLYKFYIDELTPWAMKHDVCMPTVPEDCQSAYHLFWMMTPSLDFQTRLTAHLLERNVSATFHYQPLHDSVMGRRYGYQRGDLPVTEMASECLLRIPFYTGLSLEDAARVVAAIKGFRE